VTQLPFASPEQLVAGGFYGLLMLAQAGRKIHRWNPVSGEVTDVTASVLAASGYDWTASPTPSWKGPFDGPSDAGGHRWNDPPFDNSTWTIIGARPDNDSFGVDTGDRFYRRRLLLNAAEIDNPIVVSFASDDGLWLYVNGTLVGNWGDEWNGNGECVNDPTGRCSNNTTAPTLEIPKALLTPGINVLAVRVNNSTCCNSYFAMEVSTDLVRSLADAVGSATDATYAVGAVNPQGTETLSYHNPSVRDLSFLLSWPGSKLRLALLRPDGSLHGEFVGESSPIDVSVPQAEAGTWQIAVTGLEVPHENYLFGIVVSADAEPTSTTTTSTTSTSVYGLTAVTTTTLVPVACASGECRDDDPCTEDACTGAGCRYTVVRGDVALCSPCFGGLKSVHCLGVRFPTRVRAGVREGCRLRTAAASSTGRRARSLQAKARRHLKRAMAALKRTNRGDPTFARCAGAVRDTLRSAY
jgi:hypothetical protein